MSCLVTTIDMVREKLTHLNMLHTYIQSARYFLVLTVGQYCTAAVYKGTQYMEIFYNVVVRSR
jgi:hypothetical protein